MLSCVYDLGCGINSDAVFTVWMAVHSDGPPSHVWLHHVWGSARAIGDEHYQGNGKTTQNNSVCKKTHTYRTWTTKTDILHLYNNDNNPNNHNNHNNNYNNALF